MVYSVILTAMGEPHSLTDWHVSDASEDAELDDFCLEKKKKNDVKDVIAFIMINRDTLLEVFC